ncbi:MAG: HAD family hydrolase [Fimbriimonadaceae bacterium]|nr:HAD family hydrolase [Fimbriimonadaceae bacterium]
MLGAVVFDFDGTIADTESLEFATWSAEFASRGVCLGLADWIQCVGGGDWDVYDHLVALTGPQDRPQVLASRHARYERDASDLAPRPGIRDLVQALVNQGTRLAVASSSTSVWVNSHLAQFGLAPCFQEVVTRDHVHHVKPAPDLFLLAAERLGTPVRECVAIEDSPKGVEAAKAAGMRVVAFPNPVTAPFDLTAADLVVDSLSDPGLAALLALH